MDVDFIWWIPIYLHRLRSWVRGVGDINSSPLSATCMRHIDSGNGLAPNRRQAITWTNAALLSIGS